MKSIKYRIYKHLNQLLDEKILEIKQLVSSVRESMDKDTKSSAGDKYETGRELMQLEINKHEAQLIKWLELKAEVSKINLQKNFTQVGFGSLVKTNRETYFFSVALGKINIDNETYYLISLASPIGKSFYEKEKGDSITFRNREYIIENIV